MIKQVQKNYNPPELEKRVQQRWNETNAYHKTKELQAPGDYYFVDGPPYTTGYIHLGTALNKIVKDSIIRFKRMHNLNVRDQPGYDMHGLPIEVKVEKSIGIKTEGHRDLRHRPLRIELQGLRADPSEDDERAVQEPGRMDGLGESLYDHRARVHRGGVVDA